MRKVIQETEVFTFDELSDDAKENARQWMREANAGDNWAAETMLDCTVTDAARLLGIEFVRRGAYPAIDWDTNPVDAAFSGTWRASKFKPGAIEKEFPADKELHGIAASLAIIARDFPESYADCGAGRRCTQIVDAYMSDDEADEHDVCEAITACEQTLRDFAHWIACAVDREIEYQNSDEVIDETIVANEYEFTADGEVY